MPTNRERWKEIMIESGQIPDENRYWHYNPQAIEDVYQWLNKTNADVNSQERMKYVELV